MDELKAIFVEVIGSVLSRFFVANERTHWLYLLAAVFMVVMLWLWHRRQGYVTKETGFVTFLFPKTVWLHPSARVDYSFFILNSILMLAILYPSLNFVSDALRGLGRDLFPVLAAGAPTDVSLLTWTIISLTSFLVLDATIFLCHTAMHRLSWLWEFHKVHHSAEVLVPLTLYRMHPVELLITSFAATFTTSFAAALLIWLFEIQGSFPVWKILGINGLLFLFYLFGYNLRHSHIWFAYPIWLSHFLISPAQHQIHHSSEARHLDKNMGLVLAIWDWAAGSLYVPKEREHFKLGLTQGESADFRSPWALYIHPFICLWRRTKRAPAK